MCQGSAGQREGKRKGGKGGSAAHEDGVQLDELAVLGLVAQVFPVTVDGGDAELHLGQLGQPDEIQDGRILRSLHLEDVRWELVVAQEAPRDFQYDGLAVHAKATSLSWERSRAERVSAVGCPSAVQPRIS